MRDDDSGGKLTHLDDGGKAQMVDVGGKPVTAREAIAEGFIFVQPATLRAITAGAVPKGEVLNTARIAGILAAKRCGELIPLCHPLPIESVTVDFELPPIDGGGGGGGGGGDGDGDACVRIRIESVARITGKTGVEMEALTAVGVAALTIYDMCKAIDKQMSIDGVRLVKKTGGTKSNLGA